MCIRNSATTQAHELAKHLQELQQQRTVFNGGALHWVREQDVNDLKRQPAWI